jgi:hypothetical protein
MTGTKFTVMAWVALRTAKSRPITPEPPSETKTVSSQIGNPVGTIWATQIGSEASAVERTITDHTVGNLKRTRDIINGKIQSPPTAEEILAAESARLGVRLVVKKESSE